MIIWLHLIFLSSHFTCSKHRCRLFSWPVEPILLVDQVYMGKTSFEGYLGVDYLNKMIFTFNKSSTLPHTRLSSWQMGSIIYFLALLLQADPALYYQKLEFLFHTQNNIHIQFFFLFYSDFVISYTFWRLFFCCQLLPLKFFS